MDFVEKFGPYEIARGPDGRPVELPRSPEEVVFLAFDTPIRRLVELHVLRGGSKLSAAERRSVRERSRMAADMSSDTFLRIIESGEDGDLGYYASALNDGEWLDSYISRRGALPASTAFSLAAQLLEELIELQRSPRLLNCVRLEKLMITLQEDTFLQLRVVDFGLSSHERRVEMEVTQRRLVYEVCLALFLMLTGKEHAGEDCDRFPALTGLPTGLRAAMRVSLANPENALSSIERLRDEVRDALAAQTRDLHGRASRRHLIAADSMVPQSSLRDVLLHEVDLGRLLNGRWIPDGCDQARYPFMMPATDARTAAPVTIHFLPPRRIVSSDHYEAVPLQMWRFNPEKHPNILRSLSVWESPDLTFLTEERGPGFPLSRVIAERVFLNPPEVLLVLRQVKSGIEQSTECGVDRIDIHPSNIVLRLQGTPPGREMDRLLQKRLDAWPKFSVMLRPHMTMRGLYEPLLVNERASDDDVAASKEFRAASYVALAAYLLSGERQVAGRIRLPDSIPGDLAQYITRCMENFASGGKPPAPAEFLVEFERLAAIPMSPVEEYEVPQTERKMRATEPLVRPTERLSRPVTERLQPIADCGPMESAGSVSDFDEDNGAAEPSGGAGWFPGERRRTLLEVPAVRSRKPLHVSGSKVGLVLWALAGAMLLLFIYTAFTRHSAKNAAASAGGSDPVAQNSAQPVKKPRLKKTEEVRRAVVPTEEEKEQMLHQQRTNAEASGYVASEQTPGPGA